jgi:hypothetical protein
LVLSALVQAVDHASDFVFIGRLIGVELLAGFTSERCNFLGLQVARRRVEIVSCLTDQLTIFRTEHRDRNTTEAAMVAPSRDQADAVSTSSPSPGRLRSPRRSAPESCTEPDWRIQTFRFFALTEQFQAHRPAASEQPSSHLRQHSSWSREARSAAFSVSSSAKAGRTRGTGACDLFFLVGGRRQDFFLLALP